MKVYKGSELPQGPTTISSEHAKLDIDLEVAAGDPLYYPGNYRPQNNRFECFISFINSVLFIK